MQIREISMLTGYLIVGLSGLILGGASGAPRNVNEQLATSLLDPLAPRPPVPNVLAPIQPALTGASRVPAGLLMPNLMNQ